MSVTMVCVGQKLLIDGAAYAAYARQRESASVYIWVRWLGGAVHWINSLIFVFYGLISHCFISLWRTFWTESLACDGDYDSFVGLWSQDLQ